MEHLCEQVEETCDVFEDFDIDLAVSELRDSLTCLAPTFPEGFPKVSGRSHSSSHRLCFPLAWARRQPRSLAS